MPDPAPAAPAVPAIPVGLGTFVGLGAATGQWIAAVIAAVHGDHTATTITLIVTGAATIITTLVGRYQQAKAHIQMLPSLAYAAQVSEPPLSHVEETHAAVERLQRLLGQTDPDLTEPLSDVAAVPPDEGDIGGKTPEATP